MYELYIVMNEVEHKTSLSYKDKETATKAAAEFSCLKQTYVPLASGHIMAIPEARMRYVVFLIIKLTKCY